MSVDKTFVNAMCISRQKYLLGKEKINRLLDAASFEEAFRMLGEFGFGESDVAPLDSERLLFSETVALSSFVATYAPTDEVKAFCLAPRDYLNAEYLLRRQRVGLPDVQLAHGLIPLDRLQKGIDGAYNLLPSSLAAAVKEASALFDRGAATGVAVSTLFTRAMYAYLLTTCRSRRVKGYVQWQIDAKNLSIALRSATRQELESMWIEGGKVSFDSLLLLQKGDRSALDRRFYGTDYSEVVRLALDARQNGRPLVAYENAVDSAFLRSLLPERYSVEGLAPFLLYFGYKTNDVFNVRVVLAGKLAGADKDTIKARLRVSYGE